MIRQIQLKGLSFLFAATALLLAGSFLVADRFWCQVSLLLGFAAEVATFLLLSSTLYSKDQTFFTAFAAQLAARACLFGLAVLVSFHLQSNMPMIAMAATFFVLALVQIPFLTRLTHGLYRPT